MKPLLPQQILTIEQILGQHIAAIFAEPGLGKTRATIEAIRILLSQFEIKGALIISPKRVSTMTWPCELGLWSTLVFADLRTQAGLEAWDNASAEVYLINQEQIPRLVERCFKGRRKIPVDMVVYDELSKFRSPTSSRAKQMRPYRKFFTRFVGLTGTPAPNSALDLFGQIKLLDGGERLGERFSEFRDEYAHTTDWLGYVWELREGAEEKIRERISDISISLTADEFLDIPPVTEEDVEVDFPPDLRTQYRKLEKEALIQVNDRDLAGESAASLAGKLQQFCSGAAYCPEEDGTKTVLKIHDLKTDALKKLHEAHNREPLLVFHYYKHDLTRILEAIPWAEVFSESRIDQWNAGEIPMWVCHPQSSGIGLNLQKPCHRVCWFTPTWSNEAYIQGNTRVARTGQTKPVTIHRILMRDTIDEAVVEAVKVKQEGQSGLMRALRNLRVLADSR